MKTGTTLLLLALCLSVSAQTVSESLRSLKKKKSMLFSKKAAVLSIDLIRTYDLGATDTTHNLTVAVDSKEIELESVSIGSFVLGGNGAVAASGQYSFSEDQGGVSLNKDQLVQMFECINNVYRFVGTRSASSSKNNAVATCGVGDITLGGEYAPKALTKTKRYYFKVGDATFEMKDPEFLEITKFIQDAKNAWLAM